MSTTPSKSTKTVMTAARKRPLVPKPGHLAAAFDAAYQRELAQRSDGASAEACLWAAAHALARTDGR